MGRGAIAMALLCGGCGQAAFVCAEPGQCVGPGGAGVCQPDGFCSFPDDGCPSGQRYGEHAGDASGTCVPAGAADSTSGGTGATTEVGSLDSPIDTTATTSATTSTATTSSTTGTDPDASSTAEPVDPEPLLWFTFDEFAGEGVVNAGTLGGVASCSDLTCPSTVPGPVGMAGVFDGIDDCGIFPHEEALLLDQGLSVAAWVRRDPAGADFDGVITKPVGAGAFNSWRLAVTDGDAEDDLSHFHVGIFDNSGGTVEGPISDGVWVHLVGTWDGATVTLWQDGVLIASVDNSLYEVDTQPVLLGCDDDHELLGLTNFVHGEVDDVRVYAGALSPETIAGLFAQGTVPD